MSRRLLQWLLPLLAVLALGGLVARTMIARKAEQAQIAASVTRVAPAIDLAPGDVATATQTELTRTLDISGSLKAVQSALVKARVAAEVRDIAVREGDRVRAGQLLGHLDATEYVWKLRQAEQQAASAQSQLDIAERTSKNNQALVDQGFISKNALDTSVSSADGARAALQAARAVVELTKKAVRDTEIRAPIAGLVSQRLVQPGERVAVDAKLLEIVDLAQIELEAAIAPEDVGAVSVGNGARLQVDGLAEPVRARVARINPSTQAGTRAVMVYLAVDARPGLRQGLFARGAIELARRPALVLPAGVVRVDQARPYVLAVVDGKARQRPVTLGARGDARLGAMLENVVEITAGLKPGDTVLRASVGNLRDGTPVRLANGAGPSVASAR
jgi:membrane fusion protein, multidrug efflux system